MNRFSIRYRRRGDATATSGVDHNIKLEILWTAVPTILLMIVFIWGFKSYMRLWVVPKDAIEVIIDMDHPLKENGFHPAFMLHFMDFLKIMKDNNL